MLHIWLKSTYSRVLEKIDFTKLNRTITIQLIVKTPLQKLPIWEN